VHRETTVTSRLRLNRDDLVTGALWTGGPQAAGTEPVLVSVTDFHIPRVPDYVRAGIAVVAMRRLCSQTPGALGLWLWAKPGRLRAGSVSAWRCEADLRAFVGHPDHVEIMRQFRGRGVVTSSSWWTERLEPPALWTTGAARLGGSDPPLRHATAPS
jgi:hypothetical protein